MTLGMCVLGRRAHRHDIPPAGRSRQVSVGLTCDFYQHCGAATSCLRKTRRRQKDTPGYTTVRTRFFKKNYISEVAKSHQRTLPTWKKKDAKIARLAVSLFSHGDGSILDGINENILRITPEQAETTPFESREIKELYEWRHNLLLGGSHMNEGVSRKLLDLHPFFCGRNILDKDTKRPGSVKRLSR